MPIQIQTFGAAGNPQTDLIRVTNATGSQIALIPLGARLVEAHFPDRDGTLDDIVVGFPTIKDYLENDTYAGSIAGRYANRITGGRFELEGRTYQLDVNEPPNHLHGGFDGLDRQTWAYAVDEPSNSVTFRHTSRDGHGGYPGNLDIEVTYRLQDDDVLRIDMAATTNALTVINLVHHSYWNLAGHASGSVMDQTLMINATTYLPVDDHLLPTGEIRLVEGTAFDFREPRRFGERIDQVPVTGSAGRLEAGAATGYDHNWVLNGPRGELHLAAVAHDRVSGRRMTLSTTEPGVQVYTAGYMRDLSGKDGAVYRAGAGFTLETQVFPCTPNIHYFPSARLAPGERYRHSMVIAFDVDG